MWKQLALNIDDETFQLARTLREHALSEKILTRSRVMCFDANGLLALANQVTASLYQEHISKEKHNYY